MLAVFVAIVALATLRTLLTKPVYEATAQLLIEKQNPNVLNFQGVTEERAGSGIDDYYQTQYKLLQSRSLARRVIESLDLLNDPEYGGPREKAQIEALLALPPGQSPEIEGAIGAFIDRTSVQAHPQQPPRQRQRQLRPPRARRLRHERARPALHPAEPGPALRDLVRGGAVARRRRSRSSGRRPRRPTPASRTLKRQEGLVNIEERRTLLDQRLKELGTALNERKTERLQKEALWRQMASAPNPEELPEVMRSGLVQNLRIELANLERQQAQLLERYLDQHPEVVKVKNQIQDTRPRSQAEAQRVIRAAENDYKAAAAQEASVCVRPRVDQAGGAAARRPRRQLRHAEARGGRGQAGARRPHVARQADGRGVRAQVHEHPRRGRRGRPEAPRSGHA